MVARRNPASADCKMQNFLQADEEHENGKGENSLEGGSIHLS